MARAGDASGHRFRPTPPLPSRTHVPHADDTPATHTLAPRAGARGRRHGTRVRDAGRGHPRPRGTAGSGSPAGARTARAAHRPHHRAPAPPPAGASAACAQERHRPPPRPGLHHAGLPTGTGADLNRTAPRSGRTGAPDGLPTPLGPPQDRAARVLWGRWRRLVGWSGRPRPAGARQLRPRRPGWGRLAARDERRRSGARGERRLRLGRAAGRGWGALGRTATAAGRGAGGGWELGTNGNCGWVERQGPRRARVRTRSSGNSVRLDPPWKGQVATTCRAQRLRDAVRLCHPYGGKLATASRPRSPGTAGVGAPPAGAPPAAAAGHGRRRHRPLPRRRCRSCRAHRRHRPRPRQATDANATAPLFRRR